MECPAERHPENLAGVLFVDAKTGWAVGGNPGVILHTSNGGTTWLVQQSAEADDLRAVYFIDAQTGWVAGKTFCFRDAEPPVYLAFVDDACGG